MKLSYAYHVYDSLIMCSDPEDLRRRASWDGASGTSRRVLLSELQRKLSDSFLF